MTNLTYTIDATGNVIAVKPTEGQPYTIKATKVEAMPSWGKMRQDRWHGFKQAVVNQEPGKVYVYEGFPSIEEMNKAAGVVGRRNRDAFMREKLADMDVKVHINKKDLQLAIVVSKPEVPQPKNGAEPQQ